MKTFVCSLVISLLGLQVGNVLGRDVCNVYTGAYCEDGTHCCGNSECCGALSIGAIAGIVSGVIVFISMCVTGIACVVNCLKKNNKPGQVICPNNQQGVAALGLQIGQPGNGGNQTGTFIAPAVPLGNHTGTFIAPAVPSGNHNGTFIASPVPPQNQANIPNPV